MEEGGRKWKKVEEGSGKCLHCRVAEHGQTCGICGLLNGFVDDYWCLAGSRFRERNRRGADSQNSETVRYDFNLSDIVAMDVLQVELCYLCVTCDTCPGLFAAATRSMGMPRPRMFLGRFLGLPFFSFFCNPSFWLRRAIFVLDKKVPLVGTQRGGPPQKKWNGSVGAAGPVGRTGVLRVLGWRGRVRPALPDAQLKPSRCCTLVCCCHPGCVG